MIFSQYYEKERRKTKFYSTIDLKTKELIGIAPKDNHHNL